jgi:di- and tripeptidase
MFERNHYQAYAHSGYVNCMLLGRALRQSDAEREALVTGGGDGSIRLWALDKLDSTGLVAIAKFKDTSASVLSLSFSGIFLYAGLANGKVHVYNLDSQQLVQRIKVDADNVTTVQVVDGVAFCGSSHGRLTVGHLSRRPSTLEPRETDRLSSNSILGSQK